MSEIRIVREYPYPVASVWRALTNADEFGAWFGVNALAHPFESSPIRAWMCAIVVLLA